MKLWDQKQSLYLLTVEEFKQIPDGTELISVLGKTIIKGKDMISLDTRYRHTAYGVTDPWNHPLKHLFLVFKLKE